MLWHFPSVQDGPISKRPPSDCVQRPGGSQIGRTPGRIRFGPGAAGQRGPRLQQTLLHCCPKGLCRYLQGADAGTILGSTENVHLHDCRWHRDFYERGERPHIRLKRLSWNEADADPQLGSTFDATPPGKSKRDGRVGAAKT